MHDSQLSIMYVPTPAIVVSHYTFIVVLSYCLQPGEEFRMGTCNTSGNIGGHYAPFGNGPTSASNYSQVCGPDMLEGCEVGDLTGKHTTINVYGKNGG